MTAAKKLDQDPILEIAKTITKITGVQLGDRQRLMIETRIQRRMHELCVANFDQYYDFYNKNYQTEVLVLISLLTTHHTFFFREYQQFEFLEKKLPELIKQARVKPSKTIKVWSAACSRGQEVYSIAMFLKNHLNHLAPDINFQILGTDIDSQSIAIAKNGVYTRKEINEIPLTYLSTHWARGTGDISDYVKAKPSLKSHCQFEVANLLEMPIHIQQQKFDIIFCRNVFIYFQNEQIRLSSLQLLKSIEPYGLLLVGLTETLDTINLGIKSIGPSTYAIQHQNAAVIPTISQLPPTTQPFEPLRVLCVDDSESILLLLSKALTLETGFKIVATAKNGIEAANKLKEVTVDIMTLDIHMPEENGLEYLQKNCGPNHPPVVMVTAVSRDDSDLAIKSIQLGACDFVEKPALTNFAERADEIRTKLRVAHHTRSKKSTPSLELDRSFQRSLSIPNADKKIRVIIASISNRDGIKQVLQNLNGAQPPTYILIEGSESVLPAFAKQLNAETNINISYSSSINGSEVINSVIVCDFKTCVNSLKKLSPTKRTSVLVFGDVSKHGTKQVLEFTNAQLLIEDLGHKNGSKDLLDIATDIVPVTSFSYLSSEFLAGEKQ